MAEREPLSSEEIAAARESYHGPDAPAWKKSQVWKDAYRESRQKYVEVGGLPDESPPPPSTKDILDILSLHMTPEQMVDELTYEYTQRIIPKERFCELLSAMREKGIVDEETYTGLSTVFLQTAHVQERAAKVFEKSPNISPELEEALMML